ncbi:hypothetical protein CWB97_18495, partial [Pseudoalteromonas citrea]
DSSGSGDSTGTVYDPFPIHSDTLEKGVLFIERETADYYREVHSICIKANKRFSIGQATETTNWQHNKTYIVNGIYKKNKNMLHLRLSADNLKPIEHIKLTRVENPNYEFFGTWKIKNNVTNVKAYFKSDYYATYSCDTTLGL